MSNSDRLTRDLADYLEKEPNLNRSDRLRYLKAIFETHIMVAKMPHKIDNMDFLSIVSEAKNHYCRMSVPIHLSKKRLDQEDLGSIAMMEAIIGYFNRNEILIKPVTFDYTENK